MSVDDGAGVSVRQALAAEDDEKTPDEAPPDRTRHHKVAAATDPVTATEDDWADLPIPPEVGRYLKADETKVIPVRLHQALLLLPAAAAVGGTLLAAALNGWLYEANRATPAAVHTIWILWLAAFGWAAYRWLQWRQTWFVITGHRLMLIECKRLIGRKVSMLPISKLRDVALLQTAPGRVLGYGTLDFASIGTEGALDKVRFLPWPEWLYKEVCDLSMPEPERKAMKRPGRQQ